MYRKSQEQYKMKNFPYRISSFNPCEKSAEENSEFNEQCKRLFDNGDDFRYLSFTGIKYTLKQFDFWTRTFDPETKEYLIAEDNTKIVGLCIIIRDVLDKFEVLGLVVDAGFRRKSIATQLLLTAESRARNHGFKSIHLKVFCDNRAMLINVIKLDYKPVGIEYRKRYDGEDIMSLVKYL